VSGKRVYLLIVASIATLFVLAACSEEVIPTQEPVEFSPTAASEVERPDNSGSETTKPADEEPVVASGGDADAGRNLFISCGACHNTDETTAVGPGLQGVYARAGSRTDLDADAYIAQSIREPAAFVVDGFPNVMTAFAWFSDEDIENITAYLKTLE
jgi:cytochrome c2